MVKNLPSNKGDARDLGLIPGWRSEWHRSPIVLPGKSHEQRSLAGYCPWALRESNMTECTHTDTCGGASGFLSLSATGIWGWVTPASDCFLLCRMFSTSLASLHSMPVGSLSLVVTSKNVCRHHSHQVSPEGSTSPTCITTGIHLTSLDSNAGAFVFLSGICEVHKWHCLYWLCGIISEYSYSDFKTQIKIDAV